MSTTSARTDAAPPQKRARSEQPAEPFNQPLPKSVITPSILADIKSLPHTILEELVAELLETYNGGVELLSNRVKAEAAKREAEAAQRKANPPVDFGYVKAQMEESISRYFDADDDWWETAADEVGTDVVRLLGELQAGLETSDRFETRRSAFIAMADMALAVVNCEDQTLKGEILLHGADMEEEMSKVWEMVVANGERERMLEEDGLLEAVESLKRLYDPRKYDVPERPFSGLLRRMGGP